MKSKLFSLIVLSIGLIASTTKAQTSVVDQQNIPSNTNSTISPGQTFGQSFTAGATTTLTGVGIGLNFGAPITPCVVKIFSGSGYGGTLLATKNFTTTGPGLNSVTLTNGVSIIAGNVYTFQFSSFGAPIPVNYHSGNPYPGGAFFNNGVIAPLADAIFETRIAYVGTPGQFNATTYNLNELTDEMNYTLVKPGTSNYKVLITGVTTPSFSAVSIRNNNWNTLFKMSYVPGISYGETYTVKLSYLQNGIWSSWGPASTVNTPAITPTSQLTTCSPSYTVATTKSIFTWTKVSGASMYKVKISNQAGTYTATSVRNNSLNTFALNYVTGTQPNVLYDITITAYVGGSWGAEGFPCHVMAMAAGRSEDESNSFDISSERQNALIEEQTQSNFTAELFPNPTNGNFNIHLSENASISITNTLGEIVLITNAEAGTTELNLGNQPEGLYFTNISTINSKKTIKIIKQ